MKRMFIVCVGSSATKAQRDAFTQKITEAGVGSWHHIEHSWLLIDLAGVYTAAVLRDDLREMMPGVYVFVAKVKPEDYAAFAPSAGHPWLQKYVAPVNWP
jgi:hypothetical protein